MFLRSVYCSLQRLLPRMAARAAESARFPPDYRRPAIPSRPSRRGSPRARRGWTSTPRPRQQLKTLPGIGDAYAARIIAGRPYTAKNQLVQRGILPQNVYAGISSQIIAHRPKPKSWTLPDISRIKSYF